MRQGKLTSKDAVRSYLSFICLFGRGINTQIPEMRDQLETLTNDFVKYWVSKGYDSDELVALGPSKSTEFLFQIARLAPNLDNAVFGLHIRAFVSILTKNVADPAPKGTPLGRLRGVTPQ